MSDDVKYVQITYLPHHHDSDETVVDGIAFRAYEPTNVDERKSDLVAKLRKNPFFTASAMTEEEEVRKATWTKVRHAQGLAKQHTSAAKRLEEDPVAELARQGHLADEPASSVH